MAIGPVLGYTANFNFTLIAYDFPRWQSYEYDNWNKLDATIAALYGGAGIAGVWKNGVAYTVSQRLIDNTNNLVYVCLVAHTSPATGTFAQARAANPSYWANPNISPVNRGVWATGVSYSMYDYVQSGNQFAVCVIPHVSGTFATDVSAGKWNVLIDLTGYNPTACLIKANNLSDLTSMSTARNNLGLGGAATLAVAGVFQTGNNLSEGTPATMRANLGLGSAALQASATFAQVGNNLSDITNKPNARTNLGLGNLATQNNVTADQISGIGAFGKSWLNFDTAANATKALTAFVGDPGTSSPGNPGTIGLVPAPANGDAAAGKFLAAGGTWSTPVAGSTLPFNALAYLNMAYNPRHVISQVNGNTSVASVNGYVTDGFSVLSSGIVASAQRVASPFSTRPDIPFGLRTTITTQKTTLAAGDYLYINHKIEGIRSRRLLFGATSARNLFLGVMINFTQGGTYYIAVRNGALARCMYKKVTVTTGQDQFVPLIYPGDSTGTWATDTSTGVDISITLVAGTTYQGTIANTGLWLGTNYLGATDQTNGASASGFTYTMSDIIALDVATTSTDPTQIIPVANLPSFQRHDDEELRLCQRYYEMGRGAAQAYGQNGINLLNYERFCVDKRVTPNIPIYTYSGVANVTAISPNATTTAIQIAATGVATGQQTFTVDWAVDARL